MKEVWRLIIVCSRNASCLISAENLNSWTIKLQGTPNIFAQILKFTKREIYIYVLYFKSFECNIWNFKSIAQNIIRCHNLQTVFFFFKFYWSFGVRLLLKRPVFRTRRGGIGCIFVRRACTRA